MKLTLTHEDFISMAEQYLNNMGISTEGKVVNIQASVGRKEKRITASVEVLDSIPTTDTPVEEIVSPEPVEELSEPVEETKENNSLFG